MSEEQLTKKERKEQARKEKERKKQQEKKRATQKKLIFGGILIFSVLAFIWFIKATRPDAANVDQYPDPAIGPKTATVVIKEYADFECPACAATAPALKDIIAEYGDEIRFEYNDFPLSQHKNGAVASIGGECAFQQDRFFEYHDKVFENQSTWSKLKENEVQDVFAGYAEEIGLDMNAFYSCVEDPETAERVNSDYDEGSSLGVNSTPSIFVNGERITKGPYSVTVRDAINKALEETIKE